VLCLLVGKEGLFLGVIVMDFVFATLVHSFLSDCAHFVESVVSQFPVSKQEAHSKGSAKVVAEERKMRDASLRTRACQQLSLASDCGPLNETQ